MANPLVDRPAEPGAREVSSGASERVERSAPPVLFLGVDSVLARSAYYSRKDSRRASYWSSKLRPSGPDSLFSASAVSALNQLLAECRPQVVPMWQIRLLDRAGFLALFEMAGINIKPEDLHPKWDSPEICGSERRAKLLSWLSLNYYGGGVLIVDSDATVDQSMMSAGHVLLCEKGVGFHAGQLDAARAALRRPLVPTSEVR